ncbi:MAG: 50S ribosomal protein L20 [Planctomycetes bacterium]|jgi:large subunit ribosomal protein L20|nr:50S ribosomal protein L20 [Planctomycetota bacterium]
MPRVKRGTIHLKKRKKLLSKTKGFMWGRKSKVRQAHTASIKAGAHAFKDRRQKKRDNKALWNIKISAVSKEQGISYSKLMGALRKKNILLDRKILADLAENNKEVFNKILAEVK